MLLIREIGNILLDAREKKGLTRLQLAAMTEWSPSLIGLNENGKLPRHLRTLLEHARLVDADVNVILSLLEMRLPDLVAHGCPIARDVEKALGVERVS
jgi:transcriptional regulator with XRE-family HTH domain